MFDLQSLIQSAGYIGITAIVFAENGLLIGFFLPGDSLLFTAGLLAAEGFFNPWWLIALCFVAATVGVSSGYAIGQRWGRKLFARPDSRFFKQENLIKAEGFYEKHGGMTIIYARFIPIIRTFAPVVAGIGRMPYGPFLMYNIFSGLGWVALLIGLGYWLGAQVPDIDTYLLPIIAVIIFLSILPGLIHMLRAPERRRSLWLTIRSLFRKS
jgi:membrane-associated protein